ncbi:hypothetical protein [uncultured Methylobacterium sp.]|jgi:hypothetical protein|uniref:hypothetical protein n=1 Tax=uncultured Methylobacterium sp. TaxID=157278 RepID=UPI0026325088|nr:hypothetical protein [uncultured Methylobacterium sp.]
MTKPTGRPRGRPPKNGHPTVDPDTDEWKKSSWKKIHAAREAEDDAQDPESGDDLVTRELTRPVRYGPRPKLEPDDETLRTIGELAKLFATQAEIAGVLGVPRTTFIDFLNRHPEAREVMENGLQVARISLRRKQFALADKNAPAAIFLGKNYLAQKDEHHTTTTVGTPLNELTNEQLTELIMRKVGSGAEKTKAH